MLHVTVKLEVLCLEISVDNPSPNDTLGLLKNYNDLSMPGVINPNASMGQAAYVREQCRVAVRKTINGSSLGASVSEMP